jgi:hypothetical protein
MRAMHGVERQVRGRPLAKAPDQAEKSGPARPSSIIQSRANSFEEYL